ASVLRFVKAACCDGIRKCEETPRPAAVPFEPLKQLSELLLQHGLETLPADVSFGGTVEPIADSHVVCGNRLGHRTRRAADGEEPARNLLPAADLRKGAVPSRIEIERQ